MVALSLQQFDVLTENFAAQERKLRAFSSTIGRLQDELTRLITDLEWDRARLAGLHLSEQALPATDTDMSEMTISQVEAAAPSFDEILSSEEIETLDTLELELLASEEHAVSAIAPVTVEALLADQDKIQDAISVLTTSVEAAPEIMVSAEIDAGSAIELAPVEKAIVALEENSVEAETPVPVELATVAVVTAEAVSPPVAPVVAAAPQPAEKAANKVVDLAARRRGRASMLSRSAAAVAALLMLAGSPIVVDDLLQSDIAAHLSRLGACNIEAITSDRECAVLAWLSL